MRCRRVGGLRREAKANIRRSFARKRSDKRRPAGGSTGGTRFLENGGDFFDRASGCWHLWRIWSTTHPIRVELPLSSRISAFCDTMLLFTITSPNRYHSCRIGATVISPLNSPLSTPPKIIFPLPLVPTAIPKRHSLTPPSAQRL